MTITDNFFEQLHEACDQEWDAYINHPFVDQLARGVLPERCFRHYLVQDYVFLTHFSRAWALMVYKSERLDDMRAASQVLHGLLEHEMGLHVRYCENWGITPAELENVAEARANLAYTRYVLDRGLAGDSLDLLVALAPCVIGYGEIGRTRIKHPDSVIEGNPYRAWLEMYSDPEYLELVNSTLAQMQRLADERVGAGRMDSLIRTFREATRLEAGFWDMGLSMEQ